MNLNSIFGIFILIYLAFAIVLDYSYSKKYKWCKNCFKERFLTGILQPFMEVFGNKMTAHFWHFRPVKIDKDTIKPNFVLEIKDYSKSNRIFGKNKLLSILSSIWVDINPNQKCFVIRPIDYDGFWQLVFPTDWNNSKFEEEKCFHKGLAKIVIDGSGFIMARDFDGNFIQIEVVLECKASEFKDVLFI
jgi:hypothetical protein